MLVVKRYPRKKEATGYKATSLDWNKDRDHGGMWSVKRGNWRLSDVFHILRRVLISVRKF